MKIWHTTIGFVELLEHVVIVYGQSRPRMAQYLKAYALDLFEAECNHSRIEATTITVGPDGYEVYIRYWEE